MTHVRCPLCGRLAALSSFDPSEYVQDIVVVEMASLGRARGFKVVGESSALGDQELMEVIVKRLRVLLNLIEGDLPNPLGAENMRLEDQVEELEDEVRSHEEELKRAREKIMEYEDADEEDDDDIEALLSLVNEALSDVYDEEFVDLAPAIEALVEEYHDAVEEAEDEG